MPQMAPMSWLTLFLMFTIAMMIMATMNYYLYMPTMHIKKGGQAQQQPPMNWKW